MDKLAAIRTFHAIADNGSLTEAALRLDKSVPTVVRTLAQLEKSLGVRLFNRTTRRISLTDEGAAYLDETRRLLMDLSAAEAEIAGGGAAVGGEIAVGAPIFFGELFVAPMLAEMALQHPGLQPKLRLADKVEDIVERRIDVAVRIAHLPPSELVCQRVGEVRQVICAAPGYLEREGVPGSLDELANRRCVVIDNNTGGRMWPLRTPGGTPITVEVAPALTANTMRATRCACRAGVGPAMFMSYQVAGDLASGRLVRLFEEYEPEPLPVHLVHASGRMPAPRVREVCGFLRPRLGKVLRDLALSAPAAGTLAQP